MLTPAELEKIRVTIDLAANKIAAAILAEGTWDLTPQEAKIMLATYQFLVQKLTEQP